MDASSEKALPPEKWRQVLVNIGPGDLCNVMLTSRYMSSVASCPNLWAGMKVNMGKVRDNGLMQLYSIGRFQKITKMSFLDKDFNEEQLEAVLHEIPTSPLEDINLSNLRCLDLSEVPAALLANAISGLHTGNLSYPWLTTEQCIQLLEAILSSKSLVHVDLMSVDLREVPAELLANAVSRLQSVNLSFTQLTTEEVIQVLDAILFSRRLVDVNLAGVNLAGVPANLLARAVSRLQTVILYYTEMTTEQCIQVLEASLSSTSLVHVNLRYLNLSGVPADLLARAVSRLLTVNLSQSSICQCKLTTEQCIQVLEASISSISLVDVNLENVNLSGVPGDLLARAVSRLQTVNLWSTELTTEQCIQVLEAINLSQSLIEVNLGHNSRTFTTGSVPANLLARAVSRLQTVNLRNTSLTTEQCIQVLEASLSSRSLVDLDLKFVNLSGVPADLLARAVSRLQTVNLIDTQLTTEQCIQVMEASISSKTLHKGMVWRHEQWGIPNSGCTNSYYRNTRSELPPGWNDRN